MVFDNGDIYEEGFKRSVINENIKRGKIFSKYFILLSCVLILIHIMRFKFDDYYILTYSVLLLVSLIYSFFLKNLKELCKKPIKYMQSIEIINIMYITTNIVGVCIISFLDNKFYGQVFAYVLNVIICSVIFYLENKEIAIPYCVSISFPFISLYFFFGAKQLILPIIKYLIIISVLSWFASRVLLLNYYRYYKSRVIVSRTNCRLIKETEKNKCMNDKLKKANKELMEMSLVDELTKIPNRRSLNLFVDSFFYKHINEEIQFSVIMIDIDNFKLFNDNYGHNEGDEALKKVAKEIDYVARNSMDFVARFGGEEFIYIATNSEESDIKKLAEKLRRNVMNLNITHKLNVPYNCLTISLGIATVKAYNKKDVLKCTELADKGLYICKRNGRNCSRFIRN